MTERRSWNKPDQQPAEVKSCRTVLAGPVAAETIGITGDHWVFERIESNYQIHFSKSAAIPVMCRVGSVDNCFSTVLGVVPTMYIVQYIIYIVVCDWELAVNGLPDVLFLPCVRGNDN